MGRMLRFAVDLESRTGILPVVVLPNNRQDAGPRASADRQDAGPTGALAERSRILVARGAYG